jgi:hypothetical protein
MVKLDVVKKRLAFLFLLLIAFLCLPTPARAFAQGHCFVEVRAPDYTTILHPFSADTTIDFSPVLLDQYDYVKVAFYIDPNAGDLKEDVRALSQYDDGPNLLNANFPQLNIQPVGDIEEGLQRYEFDVNLRDNLKNAMIQHKDPSGINWSNYCTPASFTFNDACTITSVEITDNFINIGLDGTSLSPGVNYIFEGTPASNLTPSGPFPGGTQFTEGMGHTLRTETDVTVAVKRVGQSEALCSQRFHFSPGQTGFVDIVNVGEYNVCDQIAGTNPGKGDCQRCLGNNGIWTAVGCIHAEPQSIVREVMKIGLSIAGGVAIIMILAAGFLLSTSQGDPKRTTEGRELLTSAVIGLLFIIFSVTILQFIGVEVLQIPGFGG